MTSGISLPLKNLQWLQESFSAAYKGQNQSRGNADVSWEHYLPPCYLDVPSEAPWYLAIPNHLCPGSSTGSHSLHFLLETIWLHIFQWAFLQECHKSSRAPFSTNTGTWGIDIRNQESTTVGQLHVHGIGGWSNEQNSETKGCLHFAEESLLSSVIGEKTSSWSLWHHLEQEISPQLLSFGLGQKRPEKAIKLQMQAAPEELTEVGEISPILSVAEKLLGMSGQIMGRMLRTW